VPLKAFGDVVEQQLQVGQLLTEWIIGHAAVEMEPRIGQATGRPRKQSGVVGLFARPGRVDAVVWTRSSQTLNAPQWTPDKDFSPSRPID
jgi:hypothetical protein